MKVAEHVEKLLRQGRKPKELIELGFPKRVVTRVRRQVREEKAARQSIAQKSRTDAKPPVETAPVQARPGSLEDRVRQLESRVQALEATSAKIKGIETRLDGTPALGLKQHFKCNCGALGYVAVHVKCTKCGRETYWGWGPE
jgi:hypothetical protein